MPPVVNIGEVYRRQQPQRILQLADRNGRRPLHDAASYGRLEAASILLRHGADVDALKQAGW